jgi:hypothetical protein
MGVETILRKLKNIKFILNNSKKIKKPYLYNLKDVAGFSVWIVDGQYIRNNINEEFTNFDQHYHFKFIPKKEFWIDKEHAHKEEDYFIDHLLIENYLMKKGYTHDTALKKADQIEQKERRKSAYFKRYFKKKKLTKKETIDKIHKKLLKKYSNKIKVWIINGELVRDLFFIDFTEGGHDKVYNFVPENEIWLDDDLSKGEMKFVLLHEIHERNLMSKGMNYEKAHRSSSRIEYFARHHRFKLRKLLKEEFKKV